MPGEVAGDDADRAPLADDDEEHGRADGDRDVRQARREEAERALLDAEERGQLLVVHLRPEADEAARTSVGSSTPSSVEIGSASRRPATRPAVALAIVNQKRRAQDEEPPRRLGRVEVEAEERARDPAAQDRHEDGAERDHDADRAEVGRVEVARVERQQEERDHARDHAAEPVDRRVPREAFQLVEHERDSGRSGGARAGDGYVRESLFERGRANAGSWSLRRYPPGVTPAMRLNRRRKDAGLRIRLRS